MDYRMKQGILYQYSAIIPLGATIAECLKNPEQYEKLVQSDVIMILGKHGRLINLNLTAAIIMEAIINKKSKEDILKLLFSIFARSKEEARTITIKYLEFLKSMKESGIIEEI